MIGDQALPERKLWAAVLEFAIRDAMRNQPRRLDETATRAQLDWRRDRDYVKSQSFTEVCLLAGIEPNYARKRLRSKLDE